MDVAVNGLDFTSLTSCWESQQYDPKLTNYKSLIYPDLALDRLMCIGPHFIYIFDCSISKFHYLSENVVNILGYHPDYLLAKSMVFLKEILHPEDLQVVFESTKKSWEFVKSVPEVQRKSFKISCDFRVKKADGQYIRLLQQNAVVNLDKKGNILYVLGVCTDISHWHKDNQITLSIVGPQEEQTFYCTSPGKKFEHKNLLSKREKQILRLLAEGYCSREISDQLSISRHTVNVHRRNMLDKLNLHNTISLIKFAATHHLI